MIYCFHRHYKLVKIFGIRFVFGVGRLVVTVSVSGICFFLSFKIMKILRFFKKILDFLKFISNFLTSFQIILIFSNLFQIYFKFFNFISNFLTLFQIFKN